MNWERFRILVHLLCNLLSGGGRTPTVCKLHGLLFHIEFNAHLNRGTSLSGSHFFRQEDGPASLALERALYELENGGAVRRVPQRLFNTAHAGAAQTHNDYGIEVLQRAPQDVCTRDDYRLVERSATEYRALLEQFDLELADLLPAAEVETGRRIDLQAACALPACGYLAADIAHATALDRLKQMQSGGGPALRRLRTIIEEHPATRTVDAAARINAAARTVYEILLQELANCAATEDQLPPTNRNGGTRRRRISGNGGSERLPFVRLNYRITSELIVVENVEVALPVTGRPRHNDAHLNGAATRTESARLLNGAAA